MYETNFFESKANEQRHLWQMNVSAIVISPTGTINANSCVLVTLS